VSAVLERQRLKETLTLTSWILKTSNEVIDYSQLERMVQGKIKTESMNTTICPKGQNTAEEEKLYNNRREAQLSLRRADRFRD